MQFPYRHKKEVFLAAMTVLMAAWATSALAQLVVSDPPVEGATVDMDTIQLPGILQSLTAIGGGGNWKPSDSNGPVSTNLFGGASSTGVSTEKLVPGFKPCKPNCTVALKLITESALQAYYEAYTATQRQSSDAGAALAAIEADSEQEITVLPLLRDIISANLNVASQISQLTEAINNLVVVETVAHAVDINATAQARANQVDEADPDIDLREFFLP